MLNPSAAIKYEKWWQRLKSFVKRRDGQRCVCCGYRPPKSVKGWLSAAHVRPRRNRPDLQKDPTWVVTICTFCESAIGDNLELYLRQHPEIHYRLPRLLLMAWDNGE